MKRLIVLGAAVAAMAFVPSAAAVTVTYTNSQSVFIPNNTGTAGVITSVNVPAGRPPIDSLDVPGVRLAFAGGGAQTATVFLRNPAGAEFGLITANPSCPTFPEGSNIAFSDSAAEFFGGNTLSSCPAMGGTVTVKPNDLRTFSFFKGQASSGNWDLIIRDVQPMVLPQGHLNGWDLKINHTALAAKGSGKKQKLRNKLTLNVFCNANCAVTSGANARSSTTNVLGDLSTKLKVSLKKKPRKRLSEGGAKAHIKLRFTNDLGEIVETKFKVRITGQNPPNSFKLMVEGSGKIGFMKGEGNLKFTAKDAGTEVFYEGDVQVGGTIAAVGQRLIDGTAKMMIKRFFDKVAA